MKRPSTDDMKRPSLSRRAFLARAATATAAFSLVPRHVLGGAGITPPSKKLNIAGIGIGGTGMDALQNLAGENILGQCDGDHNYTAAASKK